MDKNKLRSLLEEAWEIRAEGNYSVVQEILDEAEGLCEEKDNYYRGRIYHIRMQIESDNDRYEHALEYCSKSIKQYELSGNQSKIAHSKRHFADLLVRLNRAAEAKEIYQEALSLYLENESTSVLDLANAMRGYGICLHETGDHTESIEIWREVASLYEECGLQEGIDEALEKIGNIQ